MKDWRRINVALTRARAKLIVIGSRKTLATEPLLAQFLKLMVEQRWIMLLPKGAESAHPIVVRQASYDPAVDGGTRKRRIVDAVLKGRGMLRDVVNDLS